MLTRKASFLVLISVFQAGLALGGEAIPNWSAPASWSPPRARGVTTLSETNPLPFIAVTPCRVADTRGNGFTGQYGPPAIAANTNRNFTITGQCGIPSTAAAVSFNFGALDIGGAGDLRVFPAGGSLPLVSTMNYNANTPNIANAAVVALGSGGAITVRADAVTINLIIDVNGYYASTPANSLNTFEVHNSSGWAILGQTTSSGFLSRGVVGIASATTGETKGVFGETDSSSDRAAGVEGYAPAATGRTYGVRGVTLSTVDDAAGVYGVDGSGDPRVGSSARSGVRGASTLSMGVLGISRSGYGVEGIHVDSTGTVVTAGYSGVDNTFGLYSIGSIGSSNPASIIEPHPTDATKEIAYVALEGPEAGTYFRGRGRVHNGTGVIEVPESFRLVSDEEGLTVQITPIGQVANIAVLSFDLNSVVVRSSVKDLEFFYVVNGVRKAFKDWEVITENRRYIPEGPEAKMPGAFAPVQRRRLIATGIYNEDGTVNLETAERLGWARAWREREAEARAAAAANAATLPAGSPERK